MKSRFDIGYETLTKVDGQAGHNVVNALKDIAPDFANHLIEIFGDIYTRDQLDLRSREIATIASLVTLGHASPQLKVHINAALNVGVSQAEIIMQMSVYAGFPAALNALFITKEVFQEQGYLTTTIA